MNEKLMRAQQRVVAQSQRVQLKIRPQLIQGAGSITQVPQLLARKGFAKVLVITTAGMVRRGTLDAFLAEMERVNVTAEIFTDVVPDPDIACVEAATALYQQRDCQAIVAIGGGSAMDCAKAAGARIACPDKSVLQLAGAMKVSRELPFLVAVPTTAGTGSEVTAAAVITNPKKQRKYAMADLKLIPKVAVLDPELLVGLSPAMTAYTGMDALTHAVEAYLNRYGAKEARTYAQGAVQMINEHLLASYRDGADLDERTGMLLASYGAGIAFSNAFVGYVHALAHGIGGRYHVQHGLANAVLLPVVLEEYGEAARPQLADLGRAVGITGTTQADFANGFIAWIRDLNAQMGIPTTIPEIREEDIPVLAEGAEREGNPAYPVPAIWGTATFEKVLRRVISPAGTAQTSIVGQAGTAQAPDAAAIQVQSHPKGTIMDATATQTRITQAGPLLTEEGTVATPGWATQQLLEYDRSRIKASKLRIKEWDYYFIGDDDYALALTVSDLGFASMASMSLLDYTTNSFITQTTMGALSLGKLNLPTTSAEGITAFHDKRAAMTFSVADGVRHLAVSFSDFSNGLPLQADLVLDDEPRDTMVIATPWADDPHAFYYNQKIVAMRGMGTFAIGDPDGTSAAIGSLTHTFRRDATFGLLDWGRGVWTRDNTWFWMFAQGSQDGHRIGFNLGYGFGDTSAASENMFFLDGICHKLGRVDFGIPVYKATARTIGKRYLLTAPWHYTDDEGRLDLMFTPDFDRNDYIDLKLVVSDQHQVFGRFNGWVVLDDGTRFDVHDLRGAAEAVHNVY